MIKVNLLRDHTVRARKTFATPKVTPIGLIFLAIFVLAAIAIGTWTVYINQQIAKDTKNRNNLRIEDARLKAIEGENAKYSKTKHELERRIAVIEKLKEDQSGPVLLLNTVIRSIPPNADLWITSLTQKTESIKIVGYTPQAEKIPDLMNNLVASGIFAGVDLELIERNNDISKFSLLCTSTKKPQAE
jgi:Tfp pilus assembly protein PilN